MTAIPVRQAVSPSEAQAFGTAALRDNFLITDLFASGEVRMTYSHLDRTVVGAAVPIGETLKLRTAKAIGSDPFLKRREVGIFNIGGPGTVIADGENWELQKSDCLYLPAGTADVGFSSDDASDPARFYFVSAPAHRRHEARVITKEMANRLDLGTQADANRRVLRQYIHPDICESCQLVMGMTMLEEGSIWNTMPCHTHDRRSEVYLYFDMAPEVRVFHFHRASRRRPGMWSSRMKKPCCRRAGRSIAAPARRATASFGPWPETIRTSPTWTWSPRNRCDDIRAIQP